ncbi:MAG: 30S ribosomal protein S16 [Candidatus Peregrinibacteria bacterium]
MLKIRLSRTGKKSQPSFRIIVQEHTAPLTGKLIENVGYFRPADDPKKFEVNMDRVKYWISVGAQPSDTVAVLLKKEGLEGMDKFIEPRNKKRKKKKVTEAPAAAPAPAEPAAPAAEEPKAEAPAAPAVEEPKAEEPAAPAAEEPKAEEPAAPAAEEPKAEAPAAPAAEEPQKS